MMEMPGGARLLTSPAFEGVEVVGRFVALRSAREYARATCAGLVERGY